MKEKKFIEKYIAKPCERNKVYDFATSYSGKLTKDKTQKLLQDNTERMALLQDKLYADDRQSLLIVFQAMDAAGKDGTIKHVMSGINPQGCQVYAFKQPSAEELDHDYLWRINKALPERGRIGIFNRSHYEDVLVAKVHPQIIVNSNLPKIKKIEDIDDKFWKRRYAHINNFEERLVENGTRVIKFFLNVSKEEQEERFIARLDDNTKNWKFSLGDLKERECWNDYMNAYSDVLTHTSTKDAPWFVIPADQKWFMRYAVGEIICETLEDMNLNYPELTEKQQKEIEEAKSFFAEKAKLAKLK